MCWWWNGYGNVVRKILESYKGIYCNRKAQNHVKLENFITTHIFWKGIVKSIPMIIFLEVGV